MSCHITQKVSASELLIDVAEHWSILKNKGQMRILVIFQDRHVQPYHSKCLGKSFPLMWLNIGLSWKLREKGVFQLFFEIDLCSAISFKRSRREFLIDVAEHWSISKNKGQMRILVIFQDRPMFSHIIQKVSARVFHWCGWTLVYLEK